jgi:hypothetical protein
METFEDLTREVRLAQLEIAKQSIEDRDKRIRELELRVELLESMLNRTAAQQGGFPQPQPLPSLRNVPRRWTVR